MISDASSSRYGTPVQASGPQRRATVRASWRAFAAAAVVLALAVLCTAPLPALAAGNAHHSVQIKAPPAYGAGAEEDTAGPQIREASRGAYYDLPALTEQWWRWLYSIPSGVSPLTDTSGANCSINQSGPVWFLSGPAGGAVFTSTCRVPAGKRVMSAVLAYINDYPCPDPTFTPAPGQSLARFLRDGVKPFIDGITLAEARLDGRPLRVQRVKTGVFGFTGAASLAAFDSCVTGSPQLGLSDGYFVLTPPLAPGDYLLELHSEQTGGISNRGTITLKVR